MSPFPHYRQLDSMDCGPTCLRMIARFYGRGYSLQHLREKCHISREGVSMLGISDAAESIGFRTTGVKVTWEQLRDEMPLPCIVHWNQRHFVVVHGIARKKGGCTVEVADPASGLLKYPEDAFRKSWLQASGKDSADGERTAGTEKTHGVALILEPTPKFYEGDGDGGNRFGFTHLAGYLRPYRQFIVQIILAMLTASVISMILPFITQSVVDTGIGTGNLSFVVMLLVAQLVLNIGQMANSLIRSWLMLHTTSRVSISLISGFLCKLMRLPIAFFDSRMVGDIVFENVTFQYDGPHSARVLDGVSLRIPSGRVTAIVGASGSGKTTMLKMMLGFYRPVSGEVRLGGRTLKSYSERAWRAHCGSVMQEGYIFSDTIAGNIGVSDDMPDMSRVREAAEVAA